MNLAFLEAIDELEKEKGIPKDILIESIESALVSAYKKNYGGSEKSKVNVRVNIDRTTGDIDVLMRRDIVEVVEDPYSQVSLQEAQEIDPEYEIGDVIEYQVTPQDFGRIAAQTAKQVVVQRIRETERGMIYNDFAERQGELVNGIVQRISGDTIFIYMGRAEGILSPAEQIPGERYRVGQRLKVFIMDVKKTAKGPQVFLSRTHPSLVKRLFEFEVPEIQDGTVEIKSISREPGSRTKIAVCTYDENVDPVGACVGNRGARVGAVVDELSGEKIDIVPWSEDTGKYISSALSPSKVEMVLINEDEKSAMVVVPDYQLSLAIGKEGQNVRLAAKLTNWKIDIKSHTQFEEAEKSAASQAEEASAEACDEVCEGEALPTPSAVKKMKKAELQELGEKLGLSFEDKTTNAVMVEAILQALGE